MDLTSASQFSFLFAQLLSKRTPSPLDWYPPLETPKKQINLLQISQNLWILRNGREKAYDIEYSRDFEFEKFNKKFDFAMSQSVFTHLSKDQTVTCLHQLKKVMKPGGKLLFTNIIQSMSRGFLFSSKQPMITGTHLDDAFYEKMASEIGAKYIKNVIEHPTQHAHLLEF